MIIDKATGALHFGTHSLSAGLTKSNFVTAMSSLIDDTAKLPTSVRYRLTPIQAGQFIIDALVHFDGERLAYTQFNCYTAEINRDELTASGMYLTKLLNDSIVRANLGAPHQTDISGLIVDDGEPIYQLTYNFDWGQVFSTYDDKGGSIYISVVYKAVDANPIADFFGAVKATPT